MFNKVSCKTSMKKDTNHLNMQDLLRKRILLLSLLQKMMKQRHRITRCRRFRHPIKLQSTRAGALHLRLPHLRARYHQPMCTSTFNPRLNRGDLENFLLLLLPRTPRLANANRSLRRCPVAQRFDRHHRHHRVGASGP
mmetsp:Transcript_34977/g.92120  ORF Transcript_34977/g.92120 Transcript_34977/m.92120 type:complete len:138 (-) Transcript_34977:12-425(-)